MKKGGKKLKQRSRQSSGSQVLPTEDLTPVLHLEQPDVTSHKSHPEETGLLLTESDVEQHFILDLLRQNPPLGLGFPQEAIRTKHEIRHLAIGKGKTSKIHYPDYALVVSRFPVAIIEAKKPGEDLQEALREARLYAHEINSRFEPDCNPVGHVMASDGSTFIWGKWDSDITTGSFDASSAIPSSHEFSTWVEVCKYEQAKKRAKQIIDKKHVERLFWPLEYVGGSAKRSEELPQNGFGTSIALDYRNLFSPTTLEERAVIVKEAYVPSSTRDRYVEPIDRIIRAALPPSETNATAIEDSDNPKELIHALRHRTDLDHQILIVIGGVGMGKSTFIDYVREVKLPRDLYRSTVWVHLDMNIAPVSNAEIYTWVLNQLKAKLHEVRPELDFDSIDQIEKVLNVEIKRLEKGPLQLLASQPEEYAREKYHEIRKLIDNSHVYVNALVRYICGNARTKLIIVFDNSDKRVRDEQLLLFEVAQWLQKEIRSLIILPIRDETYDNHRNQPPLDTMIKDLVFRIEPPMFQEVLKKRISLALRSIDPSKHYEYKLSNGFRVSYTGKDQAAFLRSILTSVHEHDRFVRRLLTGLAGRNIRKAIELFLDFCKSGHISEELLTKIRLSEGKEALPFEVVANVLLRGTRRFYNSDESHLKNILACDPEDSFPDYFLRFAILKWLEYHLTIKGPTGLDGYHQCQKLYSDLVLAGFDSEAAARELKYLLKASCIVAEHLREDWVETSDLIKLTAAGWAHLDMLGTLHYYATISEDTYYDDELVAKRIANRIGSANHYNSITMAENAQELLQYFVSWQAKFGTPTDQMLVDDSVTYLRDGSSIIQLALQSLEEFQKVHSWEFAVRDIFFGYECEGMVVRVIAVGFLIYLNDAITGLAHFSHVPPDIWDRRDDLDGAILRVKVRSINRSEQKVGLSVLSVALT